MAKIKTYQLKGGYKLYRQQVLDSFKKPLKLLVIGGYTGSGKSDILRALKEQGEQIIDLESLANHKGSVFGGLMMPPQPTTEQFQNNLFEELLKLDLTKRIWIEDESIAVGKIFLPEDLWKQMGNSAVIEIETEKQMRVDRLVKEYGHSDKKAFHSKMEQIVKKLGGQNYNEAKEKLFNGDMQATIQILLNYYDRAYLTGLERKKHRIKLTIEWNGSDIKAFAQALIAKVDASAAGFIF